MKTLYLDCGMGAAGDMLTAALLELLPDREAFLNKLNALGIPSVRFNSEPAVKCGITGTHISVTVDGEEEADVLEHHHEHEHHHHHHHEHGHEHHHHHHEHEHHHHHHDEEEHHHHEHHHHHSGMEDIERIVSGLNVPEKVREDVMAVYGLIAEAESYAHGVPVSQIHFHEVGTLDAVADITAVCMLFTELKADEVVVSPVHVGSGQVRCAHGILPVPAPATAYILRSVPIYGGEIDGELCTPTGAALLKHFATKFGAMPTMKVSAVGYGMGRKEFPRANCVRAMLGEGEDKTDSVIELNCNVDDMTAEDIGFAMDRLFEGGALDVYTTAIGMKKSRPGTRISVLCREEDREAVVELMFKHTSTIGIRETKAERYVLERTSETVETPFGEVRRKVSRGYGVTRMKYEHDDIARIAKEKGIAIEEVKKLIEDI